MEMLSIYAWLRLLKNARYRARLFYPQPKRHQVNRLAVLGSIQQLRVPDAGANVFRQGRQQRRLVCLERSVVAFIIAAQELFEEAWGLRHDDALNAFVGGNVGELLGDLDRLVEAAVFIDQAVIFALLARPDAALADRVDVRLVFAAAFADLADEVVVSRFHELFKLRALGIAELFRLAKHAGVLAAQHVFVRNADPIIETLDDWLAADDANRSGDRRRFSHNLVRVAGDVVTARCRHVAHRNDNGLLGFRGFDRAPDDIGSQTRSARTVDAQHDRFDRFVVARFVDCPDQRIRADGLFTVAAE